MVLVQEAADWVLGVYYCFGAVFGFRVLGQAQVCVYIQQDRGRRQSDYCIGGGSSSSSTWDKRLYTWHLFVGWLPPMRLPIGLTCFRVRLFACKCL